MIQKRWAKTSVRRWSAIGENACHIKQGLARFRGIDIGRHEAFTRVSAVDD